MHASTVLGDVHDDPGESLPGGWRILDNDEVVLLVVCPDCSGPEATEFAKSTLLGQRVALIYDQSQGIYDRYGRTLAYLDKADGWDTRSKRHARAPLTPTSITTNRRIVIPRSQPRSKRRAIRSAACGIHPATATPNPFPPNRARPIARSRQAAA